MGTLNRVILSIGVDLGQRRDPTAISVVEIVDIDGDETRWRYEARHIERLPLGTLYTAVADRVAEIERNAVQTARQRQLGRFSADPDVFLQTFIDATGAVPALDFFRERGLDVVPCYFTHGDRRTEGVDSEGRAQATVGKAWLVNRLQSLAQSDRLRLPPNHPEAAAMIRELQDYEIKIDQNANDRYGAFKVGSHDDLVTSLGLAVQWTPLDTRWADDVIADMNAELSGW